ncbi:MAG TPA: molybdopterin-dependent oxidoreductase [Candidatus Sulfobium mesophilum]|nr:molybdopterin-dependent oxidoreductase [Candidatus Sulfobium mesophilum]
MIELTIDDKKISVEDGTTILKAAQQNGIRIPNMCYDKRLRPYGGCRLCVVEAEGQPRLFAACSTPVAPGMVIKTDTPKLRKARQTVLELLLIHHPLDCPICDKAGECDLQDVAYEYGKPEGRFIRHRKAAPPDVRGPLVELTANRCILCGKCVRICSEHQGRGALGLIGRGFSTVVKPAFGEILECDYCGQCIDICPTGALLSKPVKFLARAWFLEEKDTICPFCGCGCTLTLGLREGKILRSRAKEDAGRSEGNLCGRGRFGFDYIYSENRVKTPMIRKEGVLVSATWDEALNYISENLAHVIKTSGGNSVGALGSHRCTNEDNFMLRKFMLGVVGSANMDSSAAFGYAKVQAVLDKALGSKAHPISMKAPLGKEVIFIIESDISITHPVYGLNILQAKREGSHLMVADSRETKLTRHSSSHLKMTQGTSVALLNGLMKIIIDRGLFNKPAVSKISGFSEFEKSLAEYTPENVSKITGIPQEELASAAERLATAGSRMISFTIGLSENTKGADTVEAAANLVILLGEEKDALQIPAEYANTSGLYKMRIRPDGGAEPGKNVFDMLYEPGSLRALYIMGEDPVSAFPNSSKIIGTLKSLEFVVVQDIAMTETAKFAHVVLPASSWSEKEGTFINAEGVTQKLQKIVAPTGQSMPDWQILRNLSLSMGKEIVFRSIDDVSAAIKNETPEPDEAAAKRTFQPVSYTSGEDTDNEYPLHLVTRDVLQHSGTMSTRSKALDLVVSEAFLEINEEEAGKYGLSDNSHVKVSSRRGAVYLKAKITDAVPRGTVFTSMHFPHGRVNALTYPPEDGTPFRDAVKLETVKG